MKVDPEKLRGLAENLDSVSSDIDAIDVRTTCDTTANAFPGTNVGAAAVQAGEFIEGAYMRTAQRVTQLSAVTKGSANNFEVEDSVFISQLDGMDRTP